jgi:hypothetical protein
MYYPIVNKYVANIKKIELGEKIGVGWNYYLKCSNHYIKGAGPRRVKIGPIKWAKLN